MGANFMAARRFRRSSGIPAAAIALLLASALAGDGPAAADREAEEDEVTIGSVVSSIPERERAEKDRLAAERGYSVLSGVTAFLTADDNVYRSPDEFEMGGLSWGNMIFVEGDKRWKRGDELTATASFSQVQYPDYSNIDSYYARFGGFYQRPLGHGMRLESELGLSHRNDDAATIHGTDYVRDYSYWRFGGQATLRWRHSSHHLTTLTVAGVNKNYGEIAGLSSLDWNEWAAAAQHRLRFAPYHYLTFLYETRTRDYDEEPASAADGSEPPGAPAEWHRYHTVGATYTRLLGPQASVEAHYDLSTKTDLFAGYESNRAHTILIQAGTSHGRLETRFGFENTWRRYDKMLGDGDERLAYSMWRAEAGGRVWMTGHLWVFGSLSYYGRNTNKTTGSSYRDYEGLVPTLGTAIYF